MSITVIRVAGGPAQRGATSRTRPGRTRTGESIRTHALTSLTLLTSALCVGCANPGPPRPPSLHLPVLVTDLTAERSGNHVLLRWTTPSTTTDGLPVKGSMTAEICREVGPRPGTPIARLAACAPALRLAVAPGPSQVADTLPANLLSDPVVLLNYRIQIFNSINRSAGDSTVAAPAAAGTAPAPLESLQATAGERGTFLEWNTDSASARLAQEVEFARTDLSAQPAPKVSAKKDLPASRHRRPGAFGKSSSTHSSYQPDVVRLRTPQYPSTVAPGSAAARPEVTDGLLDTTAVVGVPYSYTGQRVRSVTIGAHSLEIRSDPSPPVSITLRDTFPPLSPSGLATIPSTGNTTPYIDLSWEPDTEPDLAGYLVYRQLARPNGDPQGPLARLTPAPVTAPAFRDVAVKPGQRYIYWVTAVDASGNESAPSAKAQEVITPERN